MIPLWCGPDGVWQGIPRESGDDPLAFDGAFLQPEYSPRERG